VSFESAERMRDEKGRQYHIGVGPGDVASRILLVGDPARADRVAQRMDDVRLSRHSREYVTHTGTIGGREVSVMATGMGADNTEIAVIELLQCVDDPTMIRVGSSGALLPDIPLGDAVISTGSVRLESTSLGFVEEGYPASAHHEVVLALVSAATDLDERWHLGVTATAAGFYGWQGRKGGPISPRFPDLPERLAAQGVKNFEMEASTLFTLGSVKEFRTGAVCAVFANRPANKFIASDDKGPAEERAISIALRGLDILDAMDSQGRPFVVPAP